MKDMNDNDLAIGDEVLIPCKVSAFFPTDRPSMTVVLPDNGIHSTTRAITVSPLQVFLSEGMRLKINQLRQDKTGLSSLVEELQKEIEQLRSLLNPVEPVNPMG